MKFMQEKGKIQLISLKGLLSRNGKFLVLKTAIGSKYELPGGTIELGESPKEAFEREMEEELGFKNVKMGKFLNIWSFVFDDQGVSYHITKLDFEIFSNETDIRLSPEHTDYKWISLDEIDSLDMREGHKESIRKYLVMKRVS
jgi:8-oxo-dGTP diphosphatase